MKFEEERKLLVEYGKKMVDRDLTKGSGGNLSIFIREEGLMAITPSGIDYYEMKPEDIVIMDLEDNVVDGDKRPSSEYSMHRIFYKERKDIDSVVHLHSVYSTILACLRQELPATHYLIGVAGGENVRCAKYATYSTEELARNAFEAMKDRNAVFLANHGLLVGGKSLSSAFGKAEEIELCAEVYYRAKSIGEPVILDTQEVNKMLKMFQGYGQRA
ncbi:L-fuculose-phosphate aldolase [Vallitalea sp.]|jgi:L-fuculose-phosphate aldolase|uniref:L-fuculose-phosphate aldolase n=1 Tax=Vallitalea sp. TaxID=1882829 RepID=UPI0025CF274C|nr:L-fuculose-phosphate aldolase [Vallitalea sp.]MCT4686236.1 L-fuculose-phosphate aldolase [Vallitalea sp.]